jgi:hypothetical protein
VCEMPSQQQHASLATPGVHFCASFDGPVR